MKAKYWAAAAFVAALGLGVQAKADVVQFSIGGDGYAVKGYLTVTPNTSPVDPNPNCATSLAGCRSDPVGAYKITGITGTFSDATDGISNAAITSLIPISPAVPMDPKDPLIPTSLSFGPGGFTYDNLYFPDGSPVDCTTFPFTGTIIDDYGVAFTTDGGYSVNLWGDGDFNGLGTTAYGVKVSFDGAVLGDGDFNGLNGGTVPEPSTWALMLMAFGGLGLGLRRQRAQRLAAIA